MRPNTDLSAIHFSVDEATAFLAERGYSFIEEEFDYETKVYHNDFETCKKTVLMPYRHGLALFPKHHVNEWTDKEEFVYKLFFKELKAALLKSLK